MSDPLYEFDVLGRRLYYAFTVDGVSIDEVLVREGLARAPGLLHDTQRRVINETGRTPAGVAKIPM